MSETGRKDERMKYKGFEIRQEKQVMRCGTLEGLAIIVEGHPPQFVDGGIALAKRVIDMKLRSGLWKRPDGQVTMEEIGEANG